jgi:hypothetical protein
MSEASISPAKTRARERSASARRAALAAHLAPQLDPDPAVTAYDELWFQGRPQLP